MYLFALTFFNMCWMEFSEDHGKGRDSEDKVWTKEEIMKMSKKIFLDNYFFRVFSLLVLSLFARINLVLW